MNLAITTERTDTSHEVGREADPLVGRDIVCFSHDWNGDPLSKTHFMRLLGAKTGSFGSTRSATACRRRLPRRGPRSSDSVTIGDGARVGANAVVVADIPPHCTAVGVPAHIVRRRTPPTAPSARYFLDLGDDPDYCAALVSNGSVP